MEDEVTSSCIQGNETVVLASISVTVHAVSNRRICPSTNIFNTTSQWPSAANASQASRMRLHIDHETDVGYYIMISENLFDYCQAKNIRPTAPPVFGEVCPNV